MATNKSIKTEPHFIAREKRTVLVLNNLGYIMAEYDEFTGLTRWHRVVPALKEKKSNSGCSRNTREGRCRGCKSQKRAKRRIDASRHYGSCFSWPMESESYARHAAAHAAHKNADGRRVSTCPFTRKPTPKRPTSFESRELKATTAVRTGNWRGGA